MILNSDWIEEIDQILDDNVSDAYKQQPLAQDWARISKETEEKGESIAELILLTGQNPRKGTDSTARERLLAELADRALTAIYALQHFTKDVEYTEYVLWTAQAKHINRFRDATNGS